MKALWPRVRYRLAEVKDATRPVIDQVLDQVGSGTTPVMVTGLEHLAFPGSEELGMWQNLNITRPRWVRELPRTVVFWVTEDAHRLLATRAPDLYRFRSTAIDLRLPKPDSDERVAELRRRIRTIKATPATRLRWFTELWRKTKERAALYGLLLEAMKGGGNLPEDANESLASREILIIEDLEVSDLSPLSGLKSLKVLSFPYTQVTDLSPIADLTELILLNCYSTNVSDLSPLSGLSKVLELDISATNVSSLTPLAGLVKLQKLKLSDTPVSDLSPLVAFQQLEVLDFEYTQVKDISPLKNLTKLKSLFFAGTPVSDLSDLYNLKNLKVLVCSGPSVARGQITHLRQALPNCGVYVSRN